MRTMKFQTGDTVLITAGKDKGKKGVITKVMPEKDAVIVEGINLYTRHIKPQQGRSGEKVLRERPLATAKIAIINDKGNPDRIKMEVSKKGKQRVFAKTGKPVPSPKDTLQKGAKSTKVKEKSLSPSGKKDK